MSTTYKIVRFFKEDDEKREVIKTGLSFKEARDHCRDPKTQSNDWFDGFELE
jgi:hypothetical protein